MSGYGIFNSESELIDAQEGKFGQELQGIAEETIEELGLEIYYDDDTDGESADEGVGIEDALNPNPEYEGALLAEISRLRRHAGRRLTGTEIKRIVDDLPAGEMPDLVEKYGDETRDRGRDGESRREMMRETAEEVHEAAALAEEGV